MGLFDKLKDINEMRKQAKQIEGALSQELVVGKSSGEKIKITIDGNNNVKSVEVSADIAGDIGRTPGHVIMLIGPEHRNRGLRRNPVYSAPDVLIKDQVADNQNFCLREL